MRYKGWTFVCEKDINKINTPITVFLRDPRERFVSGVNTYLQHLEAEGNQLDRHTALFFINKYLFLNRHYAPQFFWLLNLMRFAGSDTLVNFKSMEQISQLTELHDHAEVSPITDQLRDQIQCFDWNKLELYFYLDQILLDHIGHTVKLADLVKHVKTHHHELYDLVFQRSLDIIDVLPKT